MLGYGFHYVRRSCHAVEYLRDAALAVYLLHQALLAWIVRALGSWQAPPVVEFVTPVVLTGAATLAVYEYAIRRTPVGRILFGLPVRVAGQRAPVDAALERLSQRAAALVRPART